MKRRFGALVLSLAVAASLAVPAMAESQDWDVTVYVPGDRVNATTFTDAAEIENWDAVATLAMYGIIRGKADGSFDPAAPVTRAEMAKLIYYMDYGGDGYYLSESIPLESDFADVKGHWAERYVAWCAYRGIIAGRGDGTFAPDAPVTKTEAAKMALLLLGYNPVTFGLVGRDWAENTDDLAMSKKLYQDVRPQDTAGTLTRENAAQVLYNAMHCKPMEAKWSTVNNETGEVTYDFYEGEATFLKKHFGSGGFPSLPVQPGK